MDNEEYGYMVALPMEGYVFVVAENIADAMDVLEENNISYAGFETHSSVKVIR